jgi:hypothetical protein
MLDNSDCPGVIAVRTVPEAWDLLGWWVGVIVISVAGWRGRPALPSVKDVVPN